MRIDLPRAQVRSERLVGLTDMLDAAARAGSGCQLVLQLEDRQSALDD